jgi:hypothetical protein
MTQEYTRCRSNLEALVAWYSEHEGKRNEATTRLHLIDTLFFECLGWSRTDDVYLEEPLGSEYADYTFSAPRRILIVEAKKEGDYFELPAGKQNLEYSIQTLFKDYPNVKAAMEQVASYCQSRGVPYAAVSNGHQLITFIATRNDGLPPFQAKALVFPSLQFMQDKFLELWQVLSKPGIEEKHLLTRLSGNSIPELPPKMSVSLAGYPGLKIRNIFQTELQVLSELVLEDIARNREIEVDFLRECYCQSGALSQHSLLSKAILSHRYEALFDAANPGPATVPVVGKQGVSPELLAQSLSRRPIILIGDVGVGKTSFIRNLIRIDAASEFENAICLYIDLGSQATLALDFRSFVTDEIIRQLRDEYEIDIEEHNFVHGVYHGELERFRRGIHRSLLETNPSHFREKEIEFLEGKINNKEQHLKASLEHITKARRKQVVAFLDNADQRNDDIQQQAFLVAQELAERWPGTVFVALRPETFHRSQRSGTLSGYHPKAFTISPPRVDNVLKKRLWFALELARGRMPFNSLSSNTRVHLSKLETILQIFLSSLESNEALVECIDNISGGNLRLAIDLVRNFFGSGHVDTEKIIRVHEEGAERGDSYVIPLHEFLRAVMYGDAEYFDPGQSPIANIFDVSQLDPKEHFLVPLLVGLLHSLAASGGES